jgi:hypothetical protein
MPHRLQISLPNGNLALDFSLQQHPVEYGFTNMSEPKCRFHRFPESQVELRFS